MNLYGEAALWVDSERHALDLRNRFWDELAADAELRAHRTFCGKGYGMGDDSFHWMWKLLIDIMPKSFRFLEVGVYKAQVLSLVRLCAERTHRHADIFGVTLLSSFSGIRDDAIPHPDHNYIQNIRDLHSHFNQPMPTLVVGSSVSKPVHDIVKGMDPFDIIFVDACHEYDFVLNDLMFYPELIKPGGYLVVDDAANNLKQPRGFFQGIPDVTRAVTTAIATNQAFEHVLTVCHDRIFRKVIR